MTGSPYGASSGMNTISVTGYPTVPAAPLAGFSPLGLLFSNTAIGVASAPQSLQFVNPGNASLTISTISITGPNAADFAIQSNSCAATLPPGQYCSVAVTFTPSITGSEDASLTVADSAAGSPQSADLDRPGPAQTPPYAALNPTSVTFSQTAVGSTSMSSFMISDSGTETLIFSGITIGGPNPGDFTETNTCGSSIAGDGSCTIKVTFQPQAAGQRTATLYVSDNSYGSSPQSVPLTGNAVNPFGIAPSGPTTGTATPSTPATFTVNFTPAPSFSGTAIFACAFVPGATTQLSCSVSPAMLQVTASNNPATTGVKIMATYQPNANSDRAGSLPSAPARYLPGSGPFRASTVCLFLLAVSFFAFFVNYVLPRSLFQRFPIGRPRFSFIAIMAFLVACLVMPACGGSNGGSSTQPPPPQNYTIQFTAMAGTTTQTVNLSLTVQQ